jgi:hypothetical protein
MRLYELPIYMGLIVIMSGWSLITLILSFFSIDVAMQFLWFVIPAVIVWMFFMLLGPSSNWCRGCYL